ncbi:MAG: hypothetical protein PHW56_02530 [Methanosarcinaceae archaeon]|nr:hypothetical protein [Methanosarcinaceae archaeon]
MKSGGVEKPQTSIRTRKPISELWTSELNQARFAARQLEEEFSTLPPGQCDRRSLLSPWPCRDKYEFHSCGICVIFR